MVSRTQIIDGISAYINNEVIPSITDIPLKIAMGVFSYNIKNNSRVIDSVFENKMLKAFVPQSDNGMYDVDNIVNAVKISVRNYGNIEIVIPEIPFILKQEKVLTFSEDDIERLKAYIEGRNQQ